MYMYDSIMRILVNSSDGPSSRILTDTKQIYTTRRYKKRKGGAKVIWRRHTQAAVLFSKQGDKYQTG